MELTLVAGKHFIHHMVNIKYIQCIQHEMLNFMKFELEPESFSPPPQTKIFNKNVLLVVGEKPGLSAWNATLYSLVLCCTRRPEVESKCRYY